MDHENIEIYQRALDQYGITAQERMLMEECAELIDAICKHYRMRNTVNDLITELADVHIMVEQMAVFYDLKAFTEEKKRKIARLNERLNLHSNN